MRKNSRPLDPIPGSLPPLGLEAQGCVYAARCPIVRCAMPTGSRRPAFRPGDQRRSRCFYHDEVCADSSRSPSAAATRHNEPANGTLLHIENLWKTYGETGTR